MRMIMRTLLVAVPFILAMSAIAAATSGGAFVPSVTASSLVILPLLWWPLVASKPRPGLGRAALIGALAAALSHLLPVAILFIRFRLSGDSGGLGALGDLLVIFFTLAQAAIGAVVGGLLCMLMVGLERREPHDRAN